MPNQGRALGTRWRSARQLCCQMDVTTGTIYGYGDEMRSETPDANLDHFPGGVEVVEVVEVGTAAHSGSTSAGRTTMERRPRNRLKRQGAIVGQLQGRGVIHYGEWQEDRRQKTESRGRSCCARVARLAPLGKIEPEGRESPNGRQPDCTDWAPLSQRPENGQMAVFG